ncbi:HNH endonuclease [Vibrio fluvialis]|nr:HNH endonuclease [Vibrio fluvialis]
MQPYKLTGEDHANIIKAINEGGKIWESKHISDFKDKVKQHYRTEQKEQCCYCKRITFGEFKMVLDIEHILPKGNEKFKRFMFEPKNLSVACRRCNVNIKKADVSFLVKGATFDKDFEASKKYLFLHPHTDNYWKSIEYKVAVENDIYLIKYTVVNNCPKGEYTYKYFKLSELEIETVDTAQGIKNIEISPAIDDDIAIEIQNLLMNSGRP